MKTSQRIFSLIVFLLYICAIIYLCLGNLSGADDDWIPAQIFGIPIDKCIHFLLFLPYPFVTFLAFKGNYFWRTLFFVQFSGLVIVTILELSQSILTTYRTTDPWDLIANIAAITLGSVIIAFCKLLFGRNR